MNRHLLCISALLSASLCLCCEGNDSKRSESIPSAAAVMAQPLPLTLVQTAEQTAQTLCQYSRGAFPNWPMHSRFSQYLSPTEAAAVQSVSDALFEQIAPSKRPKYHAVAAFIAEHTVCRPVFGESGFQTFDASGALAFVFDQYWPDVPNIPELQLPPEMTYEEQVSLWINAFNEAYQGSVKSQKVRIVLEPASTEKFVMRSAVASSYAVPLAESSFWRSLDSYRFEDAAAKLTVLCVQNAEKCRMLQKYYLSFVQFAKSTADQFDRFITIHKNENTLVMLPGNTGYMAMQIALENRSRQTYAHVIMRTDEPEPQFCELQAQRNNRDDTPAVIPPGKSSVWCALSADTSPRVRLKTVIAAVYDAQNDK